MGHYLIKEKGMKNTIIASLSLLLVCVSAQAEVIQSVNFNPARFGQYERLKVSEKATLKGGLKAQSMRVHSAGTINLEETPSAEQGRLAYDIIKLDGSNGYFSLDRSFPSSPTLSFPSTCFSSMEDCVDSTNTGALSVAFWDGKARFLAPNSYTEQPSSRIRQITTQADLLRLEAVYATIKGTLNVTGNGVYSYRNLNTPSSPLRLAGNWIPLPSTSGAPTGATLKWENRKTVKYADHGGETVRILVLDGGSPSGCSPTNGNSYTANCPSGQLGKITYTWNQAQCKYVQTSNTCKSASMTCKWSNTRQVTNCSMPGSTYCQLVGNKVNVIRSACNRNGGHYGASKTACGTPTSPSDICITTSNHIVWPSCSGNSPGVGTVTMALDSYAAECKGVLPRD